MSSIAISLPQTDKRRASPEILVIITGVLVVFGLVMLYSATGMLGSREHGDSLWFVKRQVVASCIGIGAFWGASRIPLQWLRAASPYAYPLGIFLALLPLIPGLGDSAGGAARWVNLLGFRFQPSEIAKLCIVVFMAGYFHRREEKISRFIPGMVVPLAVFAPIALFMLLQPDFGSTAVMTALIFTMAVAAGVRLRYVAWAGTLAAAVLGLLVIFEPYRMARVMTFLTPMADPSGKGYQLAQSLIAVGSGHLTGVGLGESTQKLYYLPAAHTDFIFALVSEELGFIGSVTVLALFLGFLFSGLRVAQEVANNTFSYSLAVGLTCLIVIPAVLNMGVVIGLLPTKGLVLPLLGYGGSSMVVSLGAVGLLFGVARSTRTTTSNRGRVVDL